MNRMTTATGIALVAAFALTGCSENASEPTTDVSEAPRLPDASTMIFDLGFFGDGDEARQMLESGRSSQLNWLNAAVRVAYINVTLLTILHDPAHAFAYAIHQDPVLQEDESFLWSYSFTEDGSTYEIDLTGRIDGVHVDWELAVTNEDLGFDDFVWFYGESSLVANEGFWVFNNEEELDAARLTWDGEGDERSLRLEVVDAADENAGDSLTYEWLQKDFTLTYDDVNGDDDGVIGWHQIDGNGFIEVVDYNDGERACWDEQRQDVDCPVIAS